MHAPEQFIHTQLDTRPLLRDEWMFERLRQYPDLEVMPVGSIGLLIVSKENETVHPGSRATVALDIDDFVYASTAAERKAREDLFEKDHAHVGTEVFDTIRHGLDPVDPIGSRDTATFPGVYDPLAAILLLSQTNPEETYSRRIALAADMLREAKAAGIYSLPKPVAVRAGDWVPEIFPHIPGFIDSIETSLNTRPIMLSYGDRTAQIEKWLPLYLTNMSSALLVLTVRKRIGLNTLLNNPTDDPTIARAAARIESWTNRSDGTFIYGSEDVNDVRQVLTEFQPAASRRYGVIVSVRGTWAADSYAPGTIYPEGIREFSYMHRHIRKPAVVNRFFQSLLRGPSFVSDLPNLEAGRK